MQRGLGTGLCFGFRFCFCFASACPLSLRSSKIHCSILAGCAQTHAVMRQCATFCSQPRSSVTNVVPSIKRTQTHFLRVICVLCPATVLQGCAHHHKPLSEQDLFAVARLWLRALKTQIRHKHCSCDLQHVKSGVTILIGNKQNNKDSS